MQSDKLRAMVYKRDRGVCAACNADCEKIKRIFWSIVDYDAQMFYASVLRIASFQRPFWDADHIQEVAENGSDSLRNLQTLCVACHIEKTRLWQRTRQRQAVEEVVEPQVNRPYWKATPEYMESLKAAQAEMDARTFQVVEFVDQFLSKRIEANPQWPRRLEPQPSDYFTEMIHY